MRTFTPPADTGFYAGIDLHASFMHVWVLDAAGNVV